MVAVGLRGIQLIVFCFMTTSACFAGELPISQEPSPFASYSAEATKDGEATEDREAVPEVITVPVPEKEAPAPQEPTPQLPQPTPGQAVLVQPLPSLDSIKNVSPGSKPAESLEQQLKASAQPVTVVPVAAPIKATVPAAPTSAVSAPAPAPVPAKAAVPVAMPEVKKQESPSVPAPVATAPAQKSPAKQPVAEHAPVVAVPQKSVVRQAVQEVQEPSPSELEIEEEELVGIDTVDLDDPQGNWLFKRLWWERAEEKYEEIRALEAEVLELRMPFFMKRTDVDRTVLDPFYLHVAKDRGALEILLSDIGEFLAQEEEQEGTLDETERGMRDQLQAEHETLEIMQKNIQAILNFDRELDAAIGTLMEQLNRVSEYEREAWHYFKEIGRVLNDKKAREYVLKMKNIHRNIKEIQEYIQERYAMYFDQLIATIRENADQVTSAMDRLQEKGIDLKEQLGQIKDHDKVTEVEEVEEAPRPLVDNRGFFERYIISPVSSFFGAIWNGIVAVVQWPYNLIFGSKKPAPLEEVEYEEVAVEPPSTESED